MCNTWITMLTGISARGTDKKRRRCSSQAFQPGRCNYTSQRIWSCSVRCWKPETSSLSSANFFLEVSCRSCWTQPRLGSPSPSNHNLSAPISLLQNQMRPLTLLSIMGALLVSPAFLHVSLSPACTPPHHSPHILLFPHFPFHFPCVFLRWAKHAGRWPPGADLWLTHTAFITLPPSNPALFPSTIFIPALLNRTSNSILALRSQSETAALLMASVALSFFSC